MTVSRASSAKPGLVAAVTLIVGVVIAGLVLTLGPVILAGIGTLGVAWDELVFTIGIFAPLLVAAIIGGAWTGVSALILGGRAGRSIGLGLFLGIGGLLAAVVFARLAGTLVSGAGALTAPVWIVPGFLVVLFQVVAEEVYFRGWLQPVLARGWGAGIAVPVVAVVFAALHVVGGTREPLAILNLVLGGLVFGLLALRTGGLAAPIGMHLAWNATEQLGLGLDPNPGVGSFGALRNLDLIGSVAWGGSDAGLNASFAMTFALLAILTPLLLDRRSAV